MWTPPATRGESAPRWLPGDDHVARCALGYLRYSRHRAQFCGGVLMKVKALQGDTVDLLCQRHYGTTQGVTEIVLAANKALAGQIFSMPGRWWNCRKSAPRRQRRPCSYGANKPHLEWVTYLWSTLLTASA
jgi:hypothetical protein